MSSGADHTNEYHPGDEVSINAFYNECFGTTRSLEEWRWKFLRNPLRPLMLLRSVTKGDQLAGHCGVLPVRVRLRDHEVYAGEVVDFGIRSALRVGLRVALLARHLSRAIQEDALRHGLAFAFGFPNHKSYGVIKKVSGGDDLMEIPIWRKWLNPYGYIMGQVRSRLLCTVGRTLSKPAAKIQTRVRRRDKNELTLLSHPDSRLDVLWNRLSPALGIACVRDQRYIAWRYFDKPGSHYSVLLFHEHGEPVGYAVTSIKEEDVRIGYIVDVLCRPDGKTMKKMLKDSIACLSLASVDLVRCLMTRTHPLAKVLGEMGFRREKEGIKMLVQVFDDSLDRSFFFDTRNWYITFGDLDGM